MLWTFLVLGIILIISIVAEKLTGEINPWLWRAGGILGILFSVLGMGVVSVGEGILCAIIFYVLILVTKMYYGVGGGVLKGLMMSALYLGRYFAITLVLVVLLLLIVAKVRALRKKDEFFEDRLIMGTPILTVSVAITVFIISALEGLL